MRTRTTPLFASLLAGLLPAGSATAALSEFGIEGMHVVSTAADELRASVSPDGRLVVWGSAGRDGGGRDLWLARLHEGRWQKPQRLPVNSSQDDFDPMFSADGRWLYFASNRRGGAGGDDLYRVAVAGGDEDQWGEPVNLGPAINTAGDERAPAPSRDGRRLLFASDGRGGAGGLDLFVADVAPVTPLAGAGAASSTPRFGSPRALAAINTGDDESDAVWLGDGEALVFARSVRQAATSRLHLAQCDGTGYTVESPLALSFNTADGATRGAGLDWSRPGELLISGRARAPRAGGHDIYRMKAPPVTGRGGCVAP